MPLLYELVYGLKPELAQSGAAGAHNEDLGEATLNQRDI